MNSINDFNANCVIASSDVASAGCLNKGVSALKSQQLEILERDAQQSYGVVKHNVSVGDWNISACGIQAHNTEYFPGDEVTYNDLTYVAKVSIAPMLLLLLLLMIVVNGHQILVIAQNLHNLKI